MRQPNAALLVVAVFSRHPQVWEWASARLEEAFGPVVLCSPGFPFVQTRYYERTMGPGLRKHFLAFERLLPNESLPDIKRRTIALEQELAAGGAYPEVRPVNLDPGFLTLGKFSLATTKDQSHRVYLRDGIFAEITLRFEANAFREWPWTYADYRQPCVLEFLAEARRCYRRLLSGEA